MKNIELENSKIVTIEHKQLIDKLLSEENINNDYFYMYGTVAYLLNGLCNKKTKDEWYKFIDNNLGKNFEEIYDSIRIFAYDNKLPETSIEDSKDIQQKLSKLLPIVKKHKKITDYIDNLKKNANFTPEKTEEVRNFLIAKEGL